jgi:hypothetical protein
MKLPIKKNKQKEVLSTIEKLWAKHPELRFFQFLEAIKPYLTHKNPIQQNDHDSLFYLEDQALCEKLKALETPKSLKK